jgi:cysteine desulfurase
MNEALATYWHNPSSVHRAGQAARQRVELARQEVADLIHARPRDIIYTSGGTESADLAIRGVLNAIPDGSPRRGLVTDRAEHAAVRDPAEELEKANRVAVRWAPLGRDGVIDPGAIAPLITAETALVSIQWANNETGAIQPVRAIHDLCRAAGALFHCDATQWIGKEPLEGPPPADLMTFSPHKFHGPKGIGVLWSRAGVRLRPTILGTQELGRRGGTENVPGILGAGVAAQEAAAWLADPAPRQHLAQLRNLFESLVLSAVPDAVVNGPSDPARRLWNTTNIAFPRLEAEALLLLLSERGVNASAGAACSSGSLDPSPVLLAMGVPPELAHGSLRFSLSKETQEHELRDAAAIIGECVQTLRRSLP